MLPPSPSFADEYGPLEVCLVVSAVLNGCLLTQMVSYFSRFRDDPLGFKVVIATIWLATAASFGCAFWTVYHLAVTQHGTQVVGDLRVPVGFSAAIALEVIVHAMVQGVYIYRIHTLNRKIFLLAICCILVMAEIGVAFVWVGAVAHEMSVTNIASIDIRKKWFISLVLGLSALLDVVLTTSMCFQLNKSRADGLKRTVHIVSTLTRWTIESGMATCVMALIALIEWIVNGRSSLWIGLSICLTECYALALILLMNGRTLLNTPHEFTLKSVPITTIHQQASRPSPTEC
ncbi:hypothetical protein BD779DRAFT_1681065 [Infundibulicybe gibba]|nr:hypothetical protein BD779DRAFT_1681065 [Infundibulicybe gibba]